MALLLRLLPLMAIGTTVIVGGCAEGTKVDMGVASSGSGNVGTGGKTGTASTTAIAKGGSTGSGGKTSLLTNGGTVGAYGGFTSGAAGSATSIGSGGTFMAVGGAVTTGGTAVSTVAPPSTGLGIKMTAVQTVEGGKNIKTTMALVNQGTQAVDLRTVKIRYYFTIDSWATPVVDTYYVSGGLAKENVKIEFFSVSAPGADRYVEMSFVATSTVASPSLNGGALVDLQTGLHDQSYLLADATNDYSFTGALIGFTDRITVYVGAGLVWGVEPANTTVSGEGGAGGGGAGAGGAAGAAGAENAGASSTAGGASSGGFTGGSAGSAGASAGNGGSSLGFGGAISSAGTAGNAGTAGSAGLETAGSAVTL